MNEREAIALFKCLADKSRLQILKSLVKEDLYVELLAERLGLTAATVSFHLKKLADAELVDSYRSQYYTIYTLNTGALDVSLLDILREESEEADIQAQREAEYRQKVLDSFLEYGRLKSIPTQRKKRRIILEELTREFEPGKRYAEQEVNGIILRFHDDVCTLRRELVAERLLTREAGIYWRVS
ncbi:MAG: metalloregulator ArsR/SmtB family transcription factor [Clostridia bacterium]|nr:metalloregulator ArsR/SmtB family transcription factor [Clostridia bacterium]